MPNVQISDLPFAAIPLVGATTFFEVEATEGGVVVSRRVAADDLVISATTLFITGTSTDDPAIAAGTFDGSLLWRNVNGLQTGVFGFDPAGDNFIWSNDAEGGFHQIAIRDGTVLAETIAAAAGGLLVNNLLTGGGLERVLTASDFFAGPVGTSTDNPAVPGGTFDGKIVWENANAQQTGVIGFDPAGDTFFIENDAREGHIIVQGLDTGGNTKILLDLDPDGGSQIWHNAATPVGHRVIQTTNLGIDLYNNDLSGTATTDLGWVTAFTDLFIGTIVGDPDNNFFAVTAGVDQEARLDLFATDTALNAVVMADFDAQAGPARLYHSDAAGTTVVTIRTASLASGGAEVNNTLTGGGFERVLTTADLFAGAFIGTSTDDPTIFGGTFDGVAAWQNANLLATGAVGFEPAGDAFRVFNKTRGGDIALRVISTTPAEIDVYFYEGSAGQHLWRDNSNNRLMELRAGFNAVTLIAQQNNTPASGASQLGQFRIEISNGGAPSATFGFPESGGPSTILTIKQFVHGGQIRLVAEDNAGSEQITFLGDPDGVSQLYFAGVLNLRTLLAASGGVEVNNTLTGAGLERVLTVGDLFTGGLNDLSDVTLTAPATGAVLYKSAGDWLDTPAITIDPAGAVEIFHNTVSKLRTITEGMEVTGDTTTNCEIRLFALDGTTQLAEIRHQAGSLVLEPSVNNEGVSIFSRSSGGALQQSFQAVNSGIAQIYFGGLIRILTQSQGMTIRGNAATNVAALWEGSTGVDMFLMRGEATRTIWDSVVDSSHLVIRGNNSSSAPTECALFDPDAEVQLRFAGTVVTRTLAAASGGLEANNTLTGAGFERVLTTADRTDASVYTRNATIVEDRTLLASASATIINNNNVLAALIADLQSADIIQ